MHRLTRTFPRLVAVSALACIALAGCSARPVASVAAPTPTRAASTAVPEDPLAGFAVPLSVRPPRALVLEAAADRLVTWKVPSNDDDKIRIMAPRFVHPDDAGPGRAPADYHAYLTGLAARGAVLTDESKVRIAGVAGRLFTITSKRTIEDGLGCWSDAPDACFGLPPELTLRMATLTVDGQPVVLWARTTTARPNADVVGAFERMLPTLRIGR